MRIDTLEELLGILIENSSRLLSAGFGLNWAGSSFFDIVRLLRQEDDLKQKFLNRVRYAFSIPSLGNLDNDEVPTELIELVAHELRWPELLELAKDRLEKVFGGDVALAAGDIALDLPNAYDNDWKDREFYDQYK